MNISTRVKVTLVQSAQASGTANVAGTPIDMSGYEGVMFFCTVATSAANNFMKAQEDVQSSGATAADLAGSKVVPAANGQVCWLDVYRPAKRYALPVIVRGTATATGDIYALQYSDRKMPVVNQIANVIGGSLLLSPAESPVS